MEMGFLNPRSALPLLWVSIKLMSLQTVPLCIIHAAVVSWKVNIPCGPGSMAEKIKRIDYLGALTLVSGIALFL